MINRIVVPLDGSEVSEQVLDEAKSLAKIANAPLHLLGIIDYTNLGSFGIHDVMTEYPALQVVAKEEEAAATNYLQTIQQQLQQEDFTVEFEIRKGLAYREILRDTVPGDLIAMASHGREGLSRLLSGSVTEDVIRHANVPVLVVRADQD